jgi:hypothetical protein
MYKHKQTKNKTKPDFSVYHVSFLAKIQTFAVIYQIQLKIAIEKTVFPVQP